ncbi:MAG: hypothetical protein AB7F86_11375, partial [Bdellovibrionales bacterium]
MKKLCVLLVLLAGCTQERPYKGLAKPELGVNQELKTVVPEKVDFLFVASTVESARTASSSRPHWAGDPKRVQFKFSEKSLDVIEPDMDPRFADNPANAKAVLSIPIEHIDYKCAEDAFGKCTRKEEENKDIPWNQKRYFVMKVDELAPLQVDSAPGEIEKFIGCHEQVGARFVKAEIDANSINLLMEKVYRVNLLCADFANFEDLTDLSFTVREQLSFVKMDSVVDPAYKPIRYTRADEGNFGYFSTQKRLLDVDNNDSIESEKYFFDRWSPNRTEIVYYLSEAFNKPENAAVKKATQESIAVINEGLRKAGAKPRIVLKDPVPGMSSGDLRHSMIVLEEDPQAAGVIGYGPHASNPLTGEIVSARTIMYLGTMKKYIKYNYDELVEEKLAEQAAANPQALAQAQSLKVVGRIAAQNTPASGAVGGSSQNSSAIGHFHRSSRPGGPILNPVRDLESLKEVAVTPKQQSLLAKNVREKLDLLSQNCQYTADLFNFESAIGEGVDEVLKEV